MIVCLWFGVGFACGYFTAPDEQTRLICILLAMICFVGAGVCHFILKDKVKTLEKQVRDLAKFNLEVYRVINHNADMGNELLKRMEDDAK